MRKVLSALLAATMVASLAACSSGNEAAPRRQRLRNRSSGDGSKRNRSSGRDGSKRDRSTSRSKRSDYIKNCLYAKLRQLMVGNHCCE